VKLIIAAKVRIKNGTAKRQSHFSLFSLLLNAMHQEIDSSIDTKLAHIQ
jgi:hypothetical protein